MKSLRHSIFDNRKCDMYSSEIWKCDINNFGGENSLKNYSSATHRDFHSRFTLNKFTVIFSSQTLSFQGQNIKRFI